MIELISVTKRFGSTVAVDDCTIQFEKGRIYGLLGPNGSGKSTLLKMVAGLFGLSSGEIRVAGSTLSTDSKAIIAFMSTEGFMYEHMTIKMVGDYFEDFFADFDRGIFQKLVTDFGLNQGMKVKNLSTGMHSKLKIAATLGRKAEYIMLDEPLNGIDLVARDQIMKAVIQAADEYTSVIISSHFVEQMENILDDVIFIKAGKIELMGQAEQVRSERNKSIVELYKEVFA